MIQKVVQIWNTYFNKTTQEEYRNKYMHEGGCDLRSLKSANYRLHL